MRTIGFLFVLLLITGTYVSCGSSQQDEKLSTDMIYNPASSSQPGDRQAVIDFSKKEHDFERVIEGEITTYTFTFTNKGNKDLLITAVDADCGCTVPGFSRQPVKPGEEGEIEVRFDSKNQLGFNHKKITVVSNAVPNKTDLFIKAQVYQPDQLFN